MSITLRTRLHCSGTKKTTQNGTRQNALTCRLCSFLLCLFAVSYFGNFAVSSRPGDLVPSPYPYPRFHIEGFLIQGTFFGRLYVCGVTIFIPVVITMVVSMGPHLLRSGCHSQRTVFKWTCASPRMGSVLPSDPGTSLWCIRHLHRHPPVPFLQKLFVCICGGVVEVSVWGRVRTPEGSCSCICDTPALR